MSAALLLVALLGQDYAEAGAWIRQPEADTCQLGAYLGAMGGDGELGVTALGTATLRSEQAPRFGLTAGAGVSAHTGPVPAEGRDVNLVAILRGEYRLDDRWHLVAELRHTSTGADVLERGGANPGINRATVGLGWGW